MKFDFQLDEIVWGKVSGYPWWPGFVASKGGKNKYEVIFLSDLTRAYLSSKKMKAFEEYEPSPKSKTTDLLESFQRAQ